MISGTLRNGGWISPSLLATIRIVQATEDEFGVIGTGEATDTGGVRSTYAGGVVSPRNEMASYVSLRELLFAKLRPESAQVKVMNSLLGLCMMYICQNLYYNHCALLIKLQFSFFLLLIYSSNIFYICNCDRRKD